MVKRLTHTQEITGSNPVPATMRTIGKTILFIGATTVLFFAYKFAQLPSIEIPESEDKLPFERVLENPEYLITPDGDLKL